MKTINHTLKTGKTVFGLNKKIINIDNINNLIVRKNNDDDFDYKVGKIYDFRFKDCAGKVECLEDELGLYFKVKLLACRENGIVVKIMEVE